MHSCNDFSWPSSCSAPDYASKFDWTYVYVYLHHYHLYSAFLLLSMYINAVSFPVLQCKQNAQQSSFISVQVVHLTFLALQDQQSLLAMTSSGSLSSRRACQISTSTLTTFLSRAGSMVHPLGQAFGPLTGMRPNSSSHACRLASGCLVYVPNMPESL